MDIRDVVKTARSVTDRAGFVVPRHQAVLRFADSGVIRIEQEQTLSDLPHALKSGLKIASVTPELWNAAQERSGLKIYVREVDVDKKLPTYSYVDVYCDRAVISYGSSMNLCWRRFSVAKELMHIYSGTDKSGGVDHASDIVRAAMDSRQVLEPEGVDLDDETAAFYMALEVMIPWCLRGQLLSLRDAGATSYQIAKAFMVPEPFVTHFVGVPDAPYADVSRRLNESI